MSADALQPAKADRILVVVWWLWLVPASMASVLPLHFLFAIATRGLTSVMSSGLAGGEGIGIMALSGLLFIWSFLPLLVLSPLYGFLLWRRREKGMKLGRRFWVPIYGTAFLVASISSMVVSALVRHQRYESGRPIGVPGLEE